MDVIRGQHNIAPTQRGCVVTIGNFDGMHIGHQALLQQLRRDAQQRGLPSVVILFEPQAREFFLGEKAPARLCRLRDKLSALAALGVDRVLCLAFTTRLAKMSATVFVEQLLVQQLGVRHVVIGDDFRFGHQRAGDFALLQHAAQQHGFTLSPMPTTDWQGQRVSSTRVRTALQRGDLALAQALLGKPYCIAGKVSYGQQLGRQWGVPTANLRLHRHAAAVQGIYTVWVHGLREAPIPGVASVGTRPSVGGQEMLLEVHLLGFSQTIYGRRLCVEFLQKLRDEAYFSDLTVLRQQIVADVAQANAFFNRDES